MILTGYLTGLFIWFVFIAFIHRYEEQVRQIPQWILILFCVVWPIMTFVFLWDVIFSKQETFK